MFYLGANDQRVSLVDESGREVYSGDFRSLTNILTHLGPLIGAIALANPVGDVDANLLRVLDGQMRRHKGFHSVTALSREILDGRFLALVALARSKDGKPPLKGKGKGKAKKR